MNDKSFEKKQKILKIKIKNPKNTIGMYLCTKVQSI